MYRRIEIISDHQPDPKREYDNASEKSGLCFTYYDGQAQDVWIDKLKGVGTGKNNRYYFTEKGWQEVGRRVAERLNEVGQRFRVVKVKEASVDVMAGDDLEVAVRPRKRLGASGVD